MAIADFGSGLLAGIQGVQAATQQRREYELAKQRNSIHDRQVGVMEEQQRIASDADARAVTQEGDRLASGIAMDSGYLSMTEGQVTPEFQLSRWREDFNKGDAKAKKTALAALNRSNVYNPLKKEGFVITDIKQSPDGRYILDGEYTSGEKVGQRGVITGTGGTDGNEFVRQYEGDQLANLVSNMYTTEIVPGAAGGNLLEAAATLKMAEADMSKAQLDQSFAAMPTKDQQTTLELAVNSTIDEMGAQKGDVEAARDWREMIANAKDPQAKLNIYKQAAAEFGIAVPPGLQGDPNAIRTDQMVETGYRPQQQFSFSQAQGRKAELESLDKKIAAKSKQADAMQNQAQRVKVEEEIANLTTQRDAFVRENNQAEYNAIGDRITELEASMAKAAPTRKGFWQGKIDEAKAKRAELVQGGAYTEAMQTPEFAQFEEQVMAKVQGMTPAEADAAVDSGQVQVSDAAAQGLRRTLTDLGVNTIDDLRKLPSNLQVSTRAFLAAITPDKERRTELRQQIDNLLATGTADMTSKDVLAANENQRARRTAEQGTVIDATNAESSRMNALASLSNASSRLQELRNNIGKDWIATVGAAGEEAAKAVEQMDKVFMDENGQPRDPDLNQVNQVVSLLGPLLLRGAEYRRNPEAAALIDNAINNGLSQSMAVIADQADSASIAASIKAFFLPSAKGQPLDFRMENVRVKNGSNGQPERLVYLDPATGGQAGAEIAIADVEKINEVLARALVQRAKANSSK